MGAFQRDIEAALRDFVAYYNCIEAKQFERAAGFSPGQASRFGCYKRAVNGSTSIPPSAFGVKWNDRWRAICQSSQTETPFGG